MGNVATILRRTNGGGGISLARPSNIDLILDDGNSSNPLHYVHPSNDSLIEIHRRPTSMGRILKQSIPQLGSNVQFRSLRRSHDLQRGPIPFTKPFNDQWAAFEVLALAASYIGTPDLGANSILNTSVITTYQIPYYSRKVGLM